MTSIRKAKKKKTEDFAENAETITVVIDGEVTLHDLINEGIYTAGAYDIRGQKGFILKSAAAELAAGRTLRADFTYDYHPDLSNLPDYSLPTTFSVPRQWIKLCA